MAEGDALEVQKTHVQFEDPMPADDVDEVRLEDGKAKRKPRRIIHFVDGSTLEEYSTDEEEEAEVTPAVDPKTLDWLPWFWFWVVFLASKTFAGAEFLGEKFAWALGITSPKYQSEINEYYRYLEEQEKLKREEECEEVEKEELVDVESQTTHETDTSEMNPELSSPTS